MKSSSINKVGAALISTAVMATLGVGSTAFAQSTTGNATTGAHQGWLPGSNGGARRAPGVFGTVSAVSGDTITLTSKGYGSTATPTTYTVDATNATVTKSGATSSVSAIAVGDTLMVQGTVSGTNVAATKINDGVMGMAGGMMGRGSGVFGTVSAISGDSLTVTQKAGPKGGTATTYTVNGTNATVTKDGAASALADIAVGDTVMVQGTISGTTVTATKINDGVMGMAGGRGMGPGASIAGNGEPVVGGTVTAESGMNLTLTNKSNVTYTIDASSATVIKGNATSSISSVAVGDNVIVQGTVNGNSVIASSVMDQGAAPSTSSNSGPKGFMGSFLGSISGLFHKLFGFF